MGLEIRKSTDCDKLVMKLVGSIDALTARQFEQEFLDVAEGKREIVLDFSEVDYISSACLRSLLMAQKMAVKNGGTMQVLDPQPAVMDVFTMTKITNFIKIAQTAAQGTEESFDGFYPLRPIQRWMVDTNFQKANSSMMNISGLFRMGDGTDMERLAKAMEDCLLAHDVFRCRLVYHPDTGEVCQRFDGEIEKVVVETCSEEAFEEQKKELRMPYQLIDQPLYRIRLMITPSGKYMYTDFYHAILDGTAAGVLLLRELELRYKGREIKRQAPSYAQYVLKEAETVQADGQAEADYWREMLSGFDVKKHLPPMDLEGREDWEQKSLLFPLRNAHKNLFKGTLPCNENTFLMAAAMLAIAKSTGADESIMSWVHHGRFQMAEQRMMGLMLNQLPIRWDFREGLVTSDFLRGLEEKVQEGIEHRQSLGMVYEERLEDECASFILQKNGMIDSGSVPFADTEMTFVEMPENKASAAENVLDINVLSELDGTYTLILKYDASRYSVEAMGRYAALVDDMLLALQDGSRSVLEMLR